MVAPFAPAVIFCLNRRSPPHKVFHPSPAAMTAPPKRRWLQFSLKTLMIVTTLASGFSWVGYERKRSHDSDLAFAALENAGAQLDCDYRLFRRPAWLKFFLGDDRTQRVTKVTWSLNEENLPLVKHLAVLHELKEVHLYGVA